MAEAAVMETPVVNTQAGATVTQDNQTIDADAELANMIGIEDGLVNPDTVDNSADANEDEQKKEDAVKEETKEEKTKTEPEANDEINVEAGTTEGKDKETKETGTEEIKDEAKTDDGNTEDAVDELTGKDKITVDNARERIKDSRNRMNVSGKKAADLEKENAFYRDLLTKVKDQQGTKEAVKEEPETKESTVQFEPVMKVLEETFPEVAQPIQMVIDTFKTENAALRQEIEGLATQVNGLAETTQSGSFDAAVSKVHNDYVDVSESPDFSDYIDSLSPGQNEFALANLKARDARNITELITEFKNSAFFEGDTKAASSEPSLDTKKADKVAKVKEAGVNPRVSKTTSVDIASPKKGASNADVKNKNKNLSDDEIWDKETLEQFII